MVKITKYPKDLLELYETWHKIQVICGDDGHFNAFKVETFRKTVISVQVSVEAAFHSVFLHQLNDIAANEVTENGRKVKVHEDLTVAFCLSERNTCVKTCPQTEYLTCAD